MTVKELIESLIKCSGNGRTCAGCPQYENYHCKFPPEKLMAEAAKVLNVFSQALEQDTIYYGNETEEF